MNFPNEFRTRDMDIPYLLQHIFSRVSAGKGARAFTVFFFLFLSFFFPRLGIRRGNVSMIGSRLVRVPSALFIFETAIGERYAAQSCGVLNECFLIQDQRYQIARAMMTRKDGMFVTRCISCFSQMRTR